MARPVRIHLMKVVLLTLLSAVIGFSALVVIGLLGNSASPGVMRTWSARVWATRYEILPAADTTELVGLHQSATRAGTARCIACHGDKTDSALVVHEIHLRSPLLANIACLDCHPRVEPGPRTAESVHHWVDVAFCKNCHSAFPGTQPESHMADQDLHADCLSCHVDDLAVRHEQPYLPKEVDVSECGGCHGARSLPWTPGHETAGWPLTHGREALDAGSEGCFACHDFGLKFCDGCHALTPPSHLPAEQWLDGHPDAARADTRVCSTCHDAGDCKQCHLNHEEGWVASHPEYIVENGDTSCGECHSRSACTQCHVESAAELLTQP